MTTRSTRSAVPNKKLWAVHGWVGLYAGVVIATLSLTGVIALYKVELDHALNPHLFTVEPNGDRVPISTVIERLRNEHGVENHTHTYPPKTDTGTWRLFFVILEPLDMTQLEVFVDPYSGEVVGKRDYTHTLAYFVRQIHVRLYESLFGRQIVGLAGIALLISTITGVLIYGRFMKRKLFGAIRSKTLRIQYADYHKLVGISALAFNLMIALTGAWLGLQGYLQPLVIGDRPGRYEVENKPLTEEEDQAFFVDYEEVVNTSKTLFPELVPEHIQPSRDGSRTVRIAGNVPGAAYERHSFSLTLDKEDLAELHRYDIRSAPTGEKLFYVQESLHFGDYGGIALKILYAFFGLTAGFLALSGFVVYLERTERERRQKRAFIELKPLLLRWATAISGVCIFLAVLQLNFGPAIPAVLVGLALYGTLLFLLARALVRFVRSRNPASRNR